MTIVCAAAAQPDAEGSRHCSFALPGVRTGVAIPIAQPDPVCAARVQAQKLRRSYNTQCCETSRDEVRRVIEACRSAAEIEIGMLAVADHRIKRVDRFVGHRAGNSSGSEPEERRDDAVARALCQRFNNSPRDFRSIEMRRVAAYDACQAPPGEIEIVRFKSMDYGVGFAQKRACGERIPCEQHLPDDVFRAAHRPTDRQLL